MNTLSGQPLAVSEGHRPAHSRSASSTREYEPGSGDSHDHAPARRPHRPRPPPSSGRDLTREPQREPSPGNAGQARSLPGGGKPTGSRPLSNPSAVPPARAPTAGAQTTRPVRRAPRRRHVTPSRQNPPRQETDVPAKVDRPFHMSIRSQRTAVGHRYLDVPCDVHGCRPAVASRLPRRRRHNSVLALSLIRVTAMLTDRLRTFSAARATLRAAAPAIRRALPPALSSVLAWPRNHCRPASRAGAAPPGRPARSLFARVPGPRP